MHSSRMRTGPHIDRGGGSPSGGLHPGGSPSMEGGYPLGGFSIWGGSPSRGVSIQGVLHLGGFSIPGGVLHRGLSIRGGAPAYILPGHVTCNASWYTHPPCGQTDTCKNITFANYVWRAVNIGFLLCLSFCSF